MCVAIWLCVMSRKNRMAKTCRSRSLRSADAIAGWTSGAAAWERSVDALVDEVRPFAATHDVLRGVKERGFKLVLASSGQRKHVDIFLEL
jgi:phosphoglycolate phosphatase-like HAD superfamily hydrolase